MFNFDKFDKEFDATIKIANKYHEIARKEPDLWADDWRREGVNPYYDRTDGGLCIKFYYGMPNKGWTPWGYYKYGGGGSGDFTTLTRELFEFVKVSLREQKQTTSQGEFGPVYDVISVDGIELPIAKKLSG